MTKGPTGFKRRCDDDITDNLLARAFKHTKVSDDVINTMIQAISANSQQHRAVTQENDLGHRSDMIRGKDKFAEVLLQLHAHTETSLIQNYERGQEKHAAQPQEAHQAIMAPVQLQMNAGLDLATRMLQAKKDAEEAAETKQLLHGLYMEMHTDNLLSSTGRLNLYTILKTDPDWLRDYYAQRVEGLDDDARKVWMNHIYRSYTIKFGEDKMIVGDSFVDKPPAQQDEDDATT